MISAYLVIKLIHILSATLLFGTGLGTAFFMFKAYRHGDLDALRVTSRHVVLADWLFTAPAVVIQLVTGLWLTAYLKIPLDSVWFISVLTLFAVVGACWLPVVWIQIQFAKMLRVETATLGDRFRRLMRVWVALGIPAFVLTLVLFGLMVFKPGM